MRRQNLILLAVVLWTAACTAAPASPASGAGDVPVPPGSQAAVVVRTVDGDTVVLRGVGAGALGGGATRVRLIGVDTPEVFAGPLAPDAPECFAAQASARTASLLTAGARVRVLADRDRRDRYGRALLYVWTTQGRLVEQELLRGGWGRVLVVRPNDRYEGVLREAERQARAARRGLWGACPA